MSTHIVSVHISIKATSVLIYANIRIPYSSWENKVSKGNTVALTRRNADIVQQSIEGKSAQEIASEYSLSPQRVTQIITQALHEASFQLMSNAGELLTRNYVRIEVLIEALMEEAVGENGVTYPAVDRINKLIATQSNLLGAANLLMDPRDDEARSKYDPDTTAWTPEEYQETVLMMGKDKDFELLEDGQS